MAKESAEAATQGEGEIQCVECGEFAEGAAVGWKAYLGGGFEGVPLEVAAFCPTCATREFSGS